MSLITLDEALDHLRLPGSQTGDDQPHDMADIILKVAEASDIVLDYVTDAERSYWTDATAPPLIKAATKLVLTTLYDERAADPLTPAVKNVLRRYRDPTLA